MKQRDILLVARPDQSLDIYKALSTQNEVSFFMITFKVVRIWVKKLIPYKKLTTVGRHCKILWWGTFKHLAVNKFHFGFAKHWSDEHIFDATVKRHLNRCDYRIIHYWPENGGIPIIDYGKIHTECFVIADIHMPLPMMVFEEMKPIYEMYGIDPSKSSLRELVDEQMHFLDEVDNALVPSSYVADTYKTLYPDKKYFVVPYGISISPFYKKQHKDTIKDFMYAGGITLEKGCDLLLDYFLEHPELNIHLFGSINSQQTVVFNKYKGKENIIFHGHLSKVDLTNQIAKYDAGIHMSRFDAYSLAVGEIIGAGKPVIVSEKTGNLDDIRKYGFGLVSKLDADSLGEVIAQMLDPKTYNGFVDNIDRYVQEGHQSYGEEMMDFYKKHMN